VSRPDRLVVVTGTGTEVGKTWVGARVLVELRGRGVRVGARKPVQSFEPGDEATDADVLAAATGEEREVVCPAPRWYGRAMAPPMAAVALGRPPFTIDDLLLELGWPDRLDVGLVEGAGGPRSPLADDGDTVDLIRALRPDLVVLVADAGLGVINAVRLAAAPLEEWSPMVVVLNRFEARDGLHRANRNWLADRAAMTVVTDIVSLADRIAGGPALASA
jgi:dethiobiotin synthetase